MLGGQQDVVSGVAYKPYAKVEATTNEAVAGHGANQAIIDFARYVNQKCIELQERIIKNALLIVHPNNELYKAIRRCIDDACGNATNEQALRECMKAVLVVRVLTSVGRRGEPVCPLVWRLLTEELHGKVDVVYNELDEELNAVVNRLGMAPEAVGAIMKEVEGSIGDGEPYTSRILGTINNLAKKRLRPGELAGFVKDAVVDESSGNLVIHIVLGDGRGESFTMTVKRSEIGKAYVGGGDVEVWVTDLAREPLVNKKGSPVNGNVVVLIPHSILGHIDRFLGRGLIPDFSTVEFYEAIRGKLAIIKTPEERLGEALASAFMKFVWVIVDKDETGSCKTDSDLTGEPQAYAYLLPDEIWLSHYLWTILRDELGKHHVLETSVRAWVKEMRTSRSIVRKWDGRSVTIKNVVVLDRAKIEKALGGSVEDFIIHKEATNNEWDVGGEA